MARGSRRSDGKAPATPHGYWVKEGYLPEAVEVPDLEIPPTEITADLSQEAARIWSPSASPPPTRAPFKARVEIDATLTEEDSIVAGFVESDLADGTLEDTQIDPELGRAFRRRGRKKRRLAEPWAIPSGGMSRSLRRRPITRPPGTPPPVEPRSVPSRSALREDGPPDRFRPAPRALRPEHAPPTRPPCCRSSPCRSSWSTR